MDKYEYKLKIDELNKLIENQEYSEAQDIADTIDWEKVRDIRTLCIVSDLYKICRRYYDAKEVLLLAYVKSPKDKLIVYSLCELSIKLGDILNSIDFYNEYKELAGDDPSTYILLYKVYEIVEATSQEKIDALEAFQKFSRSYKPKWMYELAYLYHKNGRETDCVNQCNLILSFFRTGRYIVKTIELKQLHTSLSSEEEMLYKELTTPEEEIIVPEVNVNADNTIDLQKELAGHLRDILGEENVGPEFRTETVEIDNSVDTQVIPSDVTDDAVESTVEENASVNVDDTVAYNIEETQPESEIITPTDEEDNAVQAEENTTDSEEDIDSAKTTVIPVITEEMLDSEKGDTKIVPVKDIEEAIAETSSDVTAADSDMTEIVTDGTRILNREEIEKALGGSKIEDSFTDEDGQLNLDEVFASDEDRRVELDELLTLEGDGQISLVVPDDISVEKQITGQICIDEVLLMYEERRKQQEEEWDNALGSEIDKKRKDIIDKANLELDNQLKETLEASLPPLVTMDQLHTTDEEIEENTSVEEEIIIEVDVPSENISDKEFVSEEVVVDDNEGKEVPCEEVIEVNSDSSEDYDFSYLDAFAANAERLDEIAAVEQAAQTVAEAASVAAAETVEAAEAVSVASEEIVEEVTEAAKEVSENSEEDVKEEIPEDTSEVSGDTAEFSAIKDTLDKMLEEEKVQENQVKELSDSEETPVDEESDSESNEEYTDIEANLENEESTDEYQDVTLEPDGESVDFETENETETTEVSPEEAELEAEREGFTEKQWIRYESFVQTEICREQIREAIKNISHEANKGNVIIGSVDEDSAISLGKYFIEEFNDRGEINGKTVSVKAAVMNAKDAATVFEALEGGALIITNAEELRPETFRGIKEALNVPDRKVFVALAVAHRIKHKFIMDNAEYLESFTVSVDIEALDDEELVKLAKAYAYSREFGLDDMGKLALHTIISEKQTNSHSVTYKEVKNIVDDAINHASKHTIAHFFDNIIGKRYDANDMIVLGEKDFNQL